MGIRIWHQSWTVLSDLGAYDDALKEHFKRICRPDTEVVLHGMQPGSYRTDYPGVDIRHVGMQFLHSIQIVRAGVQAQNDGFDAYAISTLPDPALREVRALIDIPVVGYGEASMLTACLLGRKFSILCFISELADLLTENARRYGLHERLAGVSDVGFRFQDVLAGFGDPQVLIERFTVAARKQIEQGADVIIPGEAPLCVLLARHGVSSIDGVPILDSLSCWVKQAEMLVDLKRQSNISACRRGFYHEPPAMDRLAEVLDFYQPKGMG